MRQGKLEKTKGYWLQSQAKVQRCHSYAQHWIRIRQEDSPFSPKWIQEVRCSQCQRVGSPHDAQQDLLCWNCTQCVYTQKEGDCWACSTVGCCCYQQIGKVAQPGRRVSLKIQMLFFILMFKTLFCFILYACSFVIKTFKDWVFSERNFVNESTNCILDCCIYVFLCYFCLCLSNKFLQS